MSEQRDTPGAPDIPALIERALVFLKSCEWNDAKSEDDACDAAQALRDVLSLLTAEPERPETVKRGHYNDINDVPTLRRMIRRLNAERRPQEGQ